MERFDSYLIAGNDEHIKNVNLQKIKKKYLPGGEDSINYSIYGPEEIDRIMDSIQTLPVFSDTKITVVKNINECEDKALESIIKYIQNSPPNGNVLVMTASADFTRTKAWKKMLKLSKVLKADRPAPIKIKKMINAYFRKEGVNISSDAVDLIVELKGDDTAGIKKELEKLLSYSGGDDIEESHVEQLVGRNIKETVFNIIKALNKRDPEWLYTIINDLYERREPPVRIIGYIGWHVRMMQKIVFLKERGLPPEAMASELKYKVGYVKRLCYQAREYPAERILTWNKALVEADNAMKRSYMPPELALDVLLAKLMKN
jgi:DNA polymerase-3 subunit delta